VLKRAVLFRAMVPLEPEPLPKLPKTPVLISNGRRDPIVPQAETDRLAALLDRAGAEVTVAWQDAGHHLVRDDIDGARTFLGG
jgi:predicted esterase